MPSHVKYVFLLVLLFALSGQVSAAGTESTLMRIQERGALILGTSGNMPTMSQVDSSGRVVGFDIDIARLMASVMDVRLVIEVMPFADLLPALEAGKVDVVISNVTITPQRNLRVAFVGPYLVSGKCVVTRNEALAKADGTTDLNTPDTRLAVLEGSTSQDFARELFPEATIVPVKDFVEAAGQVKSGKASGLLTDYPICVATLKNNPDAGFVSLFSLLTYEPVGIALPANDAQFINWTENFLHRLDGTDTLDDLSKRWLGKVKVKR